VVIAVGDGKRASEPQSDDVFGFQSELGPADDASPQDSLLTVLLHATLDNTLDSMALIIGLSDYIVPVLSLIHRDRFYSVH